MKFFSWILILCVTFLLTLSVNYGDSLTIGGFSRRLQKKHPFFQKEDFTQEIERLNQKSYLGITDWNFYSNLYIARENPDLALSGPERTDAVNLNAGLQKIFWNNGSRLDISATTARIQMKLDPLLTQLYDIPKGYSQQSVSLSYQYPLLKNSQGFLDQLRYRLKEFDIDFASIQAIENKENFLCEYLMKYIQWCLLEKQLKIAEERLELNRIELQRTEKKRSFNLIDEVDVYRAEDAVRIAEQNRLRILSNLNALKSELAVVLEDQDFEAVSPEFDIFQLTELEPVEQIQSETQNNSRLLKSLKLHLNQLDLILRGYREEHKPTLDLVAQMSTHQIDENVLESYQMSHYDISLGARFMIPLKRTSTKYQIEATRLKKEKLQKQIEEIKITLFSQLKNLYVQITETEKILKLNSEQIKSSQKKTEEEAKLYNQGRGSLTFVIQSRDSEKQAKLLYTQNAATYQQMVIQFNSLMDKIYQGE